MMGLFKLFSLKQREIFDCCCVWFGTVQSNPIHISHPKYYTYLYIQLIIDIKERENYVLLSSKIDLSFT